MSGKKTVSLLVIALALGAAGAGLSMLYLKAREADLIEALKPKSQPIAVVVASKDLVKGDKLNSSTLSVREIPSDFVNPNAVKPNDFENIEGLILTENLASGKPLLHSFIDQEFPVDFSDTIPLKRRAMTIQVDETNTISGLLRPGNRVDLFVNLPASAGGEDNGKGNEIIPVVENIEVIATGRDAARDYEEKVRLLRLGYNVQPDQNFTSLTLNVTAKQAALITLAVDKGDLLALLRNRKDDSGSGFVTVSTQTINKHAKELARKAAEKAKFKPLGKLTTNANGDVVDENGNILTGLKLNDDGTVTLPDGTKVNPSEITLGPNGEIRLKNGQTIKGVNAVKTLGKLTTNANGDVVDENGNILTGLKLNEDGTVTLPDGTRVDPKDITVGADGKLRLKNGQEINGVKAIKTVGTLTTNANGDVVDENGNVLTGLKLNKDGTVTLPDGRKVKASDVIMNQDGTISLRNGEKIEGVTVISAEQAQSVNYEIDYIVGGVSSESVATVNKLSIENEDTLDDATQTQE